MNKLRFGIALAAMSALGCGQKLGVAEFRERYESECAVPIRSGDFQFVSLYASAEYLAALATGPGGEGGPLDSLIHSYGQAHYVRLSIRPVPGTGDDIPGRMEARNFALHKLLREDTGRLKAKLSLAGPGGRTLAPLLVAMQSGTQTGSANTLLIAFPKSDAEGAVDVEDWQLVLEDIGLNLGTVRARLSAPKRFRLKVAA
jgi:hypothetical protein